MNHTLPPAKFSRKHVRRAPRHLEVLEPRTLLSAVVSSYVVPNSAIGIGGGYDSHGSLWVYDINATVTGPGLERLKNGAVDTAAGSVIPLDTGTYSPLAFAMGANDHLYIADSFDAIDDVNLANGQIQQHQLPLSSSSDADMPIALAVTGDGAVWFVAYGTDSTDANGIMHHSSIIGRYDPTAGSVAEYSTGATVDDSMANLIVASGQDSVWVGLGAFVNGNGSGTNRVASASYTPANGIQIDQASAVNTGNDMADKGDILSSIADGGDGSVWFAMANVQNTAPDQIVHGVVSGGNLVQTAYIDPSFNAQTPLGIASLAFDVNGNLWFGEASGPNVGYLSPNGSYTFVANPSTGFPYKTLANADGTQLSMLTFNDNASDWPIIQIDVSAPQVTFSGTANNITIQEKTAIASGTLLATFTAPTPASAYSAVISWGDNTSTTVTPTALSNNTYAVLVSGKTFATQGTYLGSIAIKDGQTLTGTLTFKSNVSDIPLNVTSVTAVPLILRIVTVVGTFTDDPGLALSTWTATINWGDNTSSTGIIVRDPTQSGRYIVLAVHQYRTRGKYTVSMTVKTDEKLAAVTNSTLKTTVTAS